MRKYYENEQYNLAFDRWTSLMADLVIKHAPEVLEKLDRMQRQSAKAVDYILFAGGCRAGSGAWILVENHAA